jgi:flagellar assembly protein FliH
MAQLFKGHVIDDGQYPMPPDPSQVQSMHSAVEAAPSVNAADIQRASAELERLVQMVGALAPKVNSMSDTLRHSAQERGYADGIAQAQSEVQGQLMQAISALTEAQTQRHAIAQQNEAALADLALRIARKVIGAHLQADPKLVVSIVHETIRELEPSTSLVVRVNPQDMPAVEAARPLLERLVAGGGRVELAADDSVDIGGCVLVSPVGEVDARISTKLEVLETAFKAQRRAITENE